MKIASLILSIEWERGFLLKKENIMLIQDTKYLEKIRKKKTSGKRSTIFNSFKENSEEIIGFKFEPKKAETPRKTRMERRMVALKKMAAKGKTLIPKQIRRWIKLAKKLNEEVPEEILKKYNELQPIRIKPKKTKRKRKPVKYDAYIKGKVWEKIRNNFFQKYGKWCRVCKSVRYIHLHHKFYGNYGEEKDEHLVPLCEQHHKDVHTFIGRTKKDMIKETDEFIWTTSKNYLEIQNLPKQPLNVPQ